MGSKSRHLYGSDAPDFMLREMDLMGIGKKNREWDSNDWKWDGDLFVASPLNPAPLDCRSKQFIQFGAGIPACGGDSTNSSSSCSDEANLEDRQGKREHEKRRRVVVGEENEMNEEVASLSLKLGGHVYPIMETVSVNWEEKSGKKTPAQGPSSSRSSCQVEGCGADLSNARDYHRRHKVCEMHSKATNALVGNVMQRFCQQCSRFHVLQEFDEGKRSCRRRLAGHNRRRRKTHPDAAGAGNSLNDDRASSYLLITLLRILSNLHSNNSSEPKDQDLLTHLLRNFTNFAGAADANNLSGLLQVSQGLQGNGIAVVKSPATPNLIVNGANSVSVEESMRPSCFATNMSQGAETETHVARPSSQLHSTIVSGAGLLNKETITGNSDRFIVEAAKPANSLHIRDVTPLRTEASHSKLHASAPESVLQRANLSGIDLNNIYIDTQEFPDCCERTQPSAELRVGSLDSPSCAVQDNQQLSPPQASGNSDSGSAQSPTNSSGDAQSRTDRIVFKLFGKDPTNFPLVLRSQILDWLSHSPTEIEGYIRPGCIILTIYLRLAETKWEELSCDLRSSLYRLLDVADDTFWRTGWVYARIHHQMAFIYNGQVVLNTSLPASSLNHCRISSVMPIAIPVSEKANFTIKGINVCRSTTRLLCAFENEYLLPEMSDVLVGGTDSREDDEVQCISFSCSLPNVTGRGFIEVEDDALGSSFFPFIVGEQNLCSEIRTLEGVIGANSCDETGHERTDIIRARNQAMDFLHEIGWLLQRSRLWSRSNRKNAHLGSFPLKRFKWLMEFSMDHDWCAVVKKLLDVLLDGAVDLSGHSSVELVLLEMSLIHRAVRRNCRPMVELLLRYVPDKTSAHTNQGIGANPDGGYLFRPDMEGPSGVTPLHIAASRDDTENVLDALTDDPGQVGVVAWRSSRDNSGFAPEDYARLRGYYSYIHLVRKKINKKSEAGQGHVIVNIPSTSQKQIGSPEFTKPAVLQKHNVGLVPRSCKVCDQHLVYGNTRRSLPYRPLVLSVVAIAAVCVCVSILFHGPPEVLYVFRPFRWELLEYGSE